MIFFGHSMGSIISYLVADTLWKRGHKGPQHIFDSSFSLHTHYPNQNRHKINFNNISKYEFILFLMRTFDAIPLEIMRDETLMEEFLPRIQADFALMDEDLERIKELTIRCPVTLLYGENDPSYGEMSQLSIKHSLITDPFQIKSFPGGHFYISEDEAKEEVLRIIGSIILG